MIEHIFNAAQVVVSEVEIPLPDGTTIKGGEVRIMHGEDHYVLPMPMEGIEYVHSALAAIISGKPQVVVPQPGSVDLSALRG